MGRALDNLLKYGRFYSGGAQTPAPTRHLDPDADRHAHADADAHRSVTKTPTPTPTDTETATPESTATATPIGCVGDCDGERRRGRHQRADHAGEHRPRGARTCSTCAAGDVNGDGKSPSKSSSSAVNNALNGC